MRFKNESFSNLLHHVMDVLVSSLSLCINSLISTLTLTLIEINIGQSTVSRITEIPCLKEFEQV